MSLIIPASGGYLKNDSADVPATTGDIISVGCWAKSSTGTRTEVAVSLGTDYISTDGSIHIEGNTSVDMNGVVVVGDGIEGTKYGQATYTATRDTEWHQYVMVYDYDSPSLKLYVDGTLQATDNSIPSQPTTPLHKWRVGRRADLSTTVDWEGSIAEVFVYDGDLTLIENALSDLQTMQVDAVLPPVLSGTLPGLLHYDSLYSAANASDSIGGTLTASGTISYSTGDHPVVVASRRMVYRREWTGEEIADNTRSDFVFPAHASGGNPPVVTSTSCIWNALTPASSLAVHEKGFELLLLNAGDVSAADGKVVFEWDLDLTRKQDHHDPRYGISDGTNAQQIKRNNEGTGHASLESISTLWGIDDGDKKITSQGTNDIGVEGSQQPAIGGSYTGLINRITLTTSNTEMFCGPITGGLIADTNTGETDVQAWGDPILDMDAALTLTFSSDGDITNHYQIDNMIVSAWVEPEVRTDIERGLIYHAKLDEASGDVPNDYTGTATLAVDTSNAPATVTQAATSLLPNGQGTAVTFADNGRITSTPEPESAANTDFTFSAFFKLTSAYVATTMYLVTGDSGADGLAVTSNTQITVRFGNDLNSTATVAAIGTDTHHIAVTRSAIADKVTVWLDGVPSACAANANASRNWKTGQLGGRWDTALDLNGTLDDVRLYDRVLNTAEIDKLRLTPYTPGKGASPKITGGMTPAVAYSPDNSRY